MLLLPFSRYINLSCFYVLLDAYSSTPCLHPQPHWSSTGTGLIRPQHTGCLWWGKHCTDNWAIDTKVLITVIYWKTSHKCTHLDCTVSLLSFHSTEWPLSTSPARRAVSNWVYHFSSWGTALHTKLTRYSNVKALEHQVQMLPIKRLLSLPNPFKFKEWASHTYPVCHVIHTVMLWLVVITLAHAHTPTGIPNS